MEEKKFFANNDDDGADDDIGLGQKVKVKPSLSMP
jgi:hypothetical protein